ncbi:MAG: hypothetical protein JSS27_16195 [Planctomycetes bacterium]|nr:hypothetical protein [Planctomycetota bacterium]
MTPMNPNLNQTGRWAGFVALQVLVLGAGVTWASYSALKLSAWHALPKLLSEPRLVAPPHDYSVVVTDEQLERVLRKLGPHNLGPKTKLNHIDHALRFWGIPAKFTDKSLFSGEELRDVLTDTRKFKALYGDQVPALLIDFERGVRVRTQEGHQTSSHVDHTLTGLAEVGTPLDFPLVTPLRQTTYRAMLEQTLRDFSLNQLEYEWSALAFTLFFAPGAHYVTSEGQEITFDMLARRIMRQEMPQGVCFANHRLYTLTCMLRIHDEQTPLFSEQVRGEVHDYLFRITQLLVASQSTEGYWDGNWPTVRKKTTDAGRTSGDTVADRILATGHALEWWAMAPESLHPPRGVLAAAGQWMVKTIDELTPEKTEEYFTYLSHAGRSLSIWRGKWPWQVVNANLDAAKSAPAK